MTQTKVNDTPIGLSTPGVFAPISALAPSSASNEASPNISRSSSTTNAPALNSSPQMQTNPASKKLQKILESRFESDKDAIAAMQYLSEVIPENTIATRRNLRSDLERRNLASSREFLHKFGEVRNELHSLAKIVDGMSKSCALMQEELHSTKESTAALMQRTNELNDEAKLLTMQQTLTEAFCNKFYILPEEEKLLRSKEFLTTKDVPHLLQVLKKIKKIHGDAKVLLRSRNQTTGLEIVERMGQFEELGFEKLYRWAQRECRNMLAESPEIGSLLVEALAALSERKTLLNYTMDEFCMVRKGVVSRGFIDALTRGSGGSGNSVKPIEMHAHDPVRYIGDMLAWIHQALASERELVEIMLQKTEGNSEDIGYFVAFSSEGLCRPLKVRLDHVIANDPDVITMFKVRALLKFYYSTFAESVSPTSPLSTAMLENASLFDKLFFSTLRTSLNALIEQKQGVTSDLSPSNSLEKILVLLQQILHSYTTAFFDPKSRQTDFKTVIDIIVTSLLQCLQQSAASATEPSNMAVFMMNSLHKMKSTLGVYEFTDEKIEMITAQIDAHLDTFIHEQVTSFLNSTEMMFAYNKQVNNETVFTDAEVEKVKKSAHTLDKFLSNPDQFVLPQAKLILSATLREAAITRSHTYFAQIYSNVYECITKWRNQTFVEFLRTPEQVKSLLV